MSDEAEKLARRVRDALGVHNDDDAPVTELVRKLAARATPQPPAEARPNWKEAPLGATHYQPQQGAYYKRASASDWYVWSRNEDRELMRWLPSPGTSDNAEWVVPPAEAQARGQAVDREADRARFSDAAFNAWLDTGISDAGHTVWDAVGDTQAAWAGWEARQFAGDAVLISECCGREECGGECGNEWRGMGMYRKPADAAPTSAPVGVEVLPAKWRDAASGMEGTWDDKSQDGYRAGLEECAEQLEAALAQQPSADPGACPACNRAWSEHRIGYSASACKMKQPEAVDEVMAEVRRIARHMKKRALDGATRSALLYSDDMREYADRLLALAAQQGGSDNQHGGA